MAPTPSFPDWQRRQRRKAVLVKALFLALGFAVGFLCHGCAHQQRTAPVVFDERAGGVVARALEKATGHKVDAITLPGAPPIIFRNSDDPCLLRHELVHVTQQQRDGVEVWTARYLREYLDPAIGYARMAYEVEAREAQRECEFSMRVGVAANGWSDPEMRRMAREHAQEMGGGLRP